MSKHDDQLEEMRKLDAVVRQLGIEDSIETPADAVAKLQAEIMRMRLIIHAKPNQAMLEAARDWSAAKYGKPIGDDAARGCWVSMISAAVKTKP